MDTDQGSSTTVELTKVNPKKHVVRFEADDPKAIVQNVYVDNAWVEANQAHEGIRITIEPIRSKGSTS